MPTTPESLDAVTGNSRKTVVARVSKLTQTTTGRSVWGTLRALSSTFRKYLAYIFFSALFYPTIAMAVPETEIDPIEVVGQRPASNYWKIFVAGSQINVPFGNYVGQAAQEIANFYMDVNDNVKQQNKEAERMKNADIRCKADLPIAMRQVTSQSTYDQRYGVAAEVQRLAALASQPTLWQWLANSVIASLYGGFEGNFLYSFRIMYADSGTEWWSIRLNNLDNSPVGPVIPNSNYGSITGGGVLKPSPFCSN